MNGRIFPADRIIRRAEVAQLVEHATENRGVPSSILGLGTISPNLKSGRAMTRNWVNLLIRSLAYLYFAAGMALLVFGGMPSALRYQADKTLPATLLLITGLGIFGLLAFGNWGKFGRPISRRKWILLCVLSSLGFVVLIFAPTSYGGSGT